MTTTHRTPSDAGNRRFFLLNYLGLRFGAVEGLSSEVSS